MASLDTLRLKGDAMKTTRWMTLVGLAIAASLIVGCAPTRLEQDFGTSQRLVKMNQTLDPQAGQTDKPVTGLDGVRIRLRRHHAGRGPQRIRLLLRQRRR